LAASGRRSPRRFPCSAELWIIITTALCLRVDVTATKMPCVVPNYVVKRFKYQFAVRVSADSWQEIDIVSETAQSVSYVPAHSAANLFHLSCQHSTIQLWKTEYYYYALFHRRCDVMPRLYNNIVIFFLITRIPTVVILLLLLTTRPFPLVHKIMTFCKVINLTKFDRL
jgi:hypothetical protein